MKNLVLLAALFAAGFAMPAMAVEPIGGNTTAAATPAPATGLGAQLRAPAIVKENQPAPLKNPPALKRHRRHGGGAAVRGTAVTGQKRWVARDFQTGPSGQPAGNLSPALKKGPAPFDSANLGLQQDQNEETQQYNTLSKSSAKRHEATKNSISNVR